MTAVFRKNHGGTEVKIFSYLYDAEGRVSKVTDHMGGTSHLLFYDFLGRLCQADGSDSSYYRFKYDENGNMTMLQAVNGESRTATYTYDRDNREVTAKALTKTRTTEYDVYGRITARTWKKNQAGEYDTRYRYCDSGDRKDILVREIENGGQVTACTFSSA